MTLIGIELLQSFIADGSYREMKFLENEMQVLKECVQKQLDETGILTNRIEWKDVGVVAKYSKVNKYEYDREGLNSLLDSLGVLPLVARLDRNLICLEEETKLAPFICGVNHMIRYIPNSRSQQTSDIVCVEHVSKQDIKTNLIRWKECNRQYNLLNHDWRRRKNSVIKSFAFAEQNTIICEYGRFNLVRKFDYNMVDMFQKTGREFLIKKSTVAMSAINTFVAKGIVSKKDLDYFRKVVDVLLRFTLMESSSEERNRQNFYRRLQKLSRGSTEM